MKKLLILTLFVCAASLMSFTTSNQSFEWKTWNNGFPLAKEDGKIALIDTYTAWCGWCKKMDRDTYEDPTIISKINKDFVPIKFNPELPGEYNLGDTVVDGRTLLAALSRGQHSGYPTTFFYLPAKNQMLKYPGYMDAAKFGALLDQLVQYNNASAN